MAKILIPTALRQFADQNDSVEVDGARSPMRWISSPRTIRTSRRTCSTIKASFAAL